MIRKLRVKFVCFNMLVVICMLLLLFGVVLTFMQRGLVEDQIETLSNIAELPAPFSSAPSPEGWENLRFPWFLLEKRGGVLYYADSMDNSARSDEVVFSAMFDAACAAERETGVLLDYELRYFRKPIPEGMRVVFTSISAEKSTLTHLWRISSVVGFLSIALFLLLSLLLSHWAIHPVKTAWQQQKQFVADASHELKTPLTVLMANAEMLQDEHYSEEQRRQFSGNILTVSRQMRGLLEQLLALARFDNAYEKPPFASVDFSALVEECVLPFEPVFFERGLELSCRVEPELRVLGVDSSLRQLVDILLDNAQKYSEPGTVSLSLRRQLFHCVLAVENPYPELSRAERRKVFKRFYRKDEARTDSGSYGLGLPIAEAIVSLHGGRISCDWEGGKIRFTVLLPLEQEL